MPAAMPAEIAERLSDTADTLPVEQFTKRAREDLIEKFMAGDMVEGVWLRDVLDDAMQTNYAATVHSLAEDLSDIGAMGDLRLHERVERLSNWLRGHVEFYLDHRNPSLVERRAEALAEEPEDY